MAATPRPAVYFFCADPLKDPVAWRVFEASTRLLDLRETDLTVDGYAVVESRDAQDNVLLYVRTREVLSHDYATYLPVLRAHFADAAFAGLVNWHAGKNAPDAILTVHTTGDVVSGIFGPADPIATRNLVLALEDNRRAAGLETFTTMTEATHWSGVPYGGSPAWIPQYPVPLVDIEIGSSPASWANASAVEVVARSLPQVFTPPAAPLRSLLCVGGVHVEPAFVGAVLATRTTSPLAVSHILPNHWVVDGAYDTAAGRAKLDACVASILGGVHGIVFHDNLKGAYKAQVRLLAEQLGVPAFKHQALRQPHTLPLW